MLLMAVGEFDSVPSAQLGKVYLTSHMEASAVCHEAEDDILDLLLLWVKKNKVDRDSNTLNLTHTIDTPAGYNTRKQFVDGLQSVGMWGSVTGFPSACEVRQDCLIDELHLPVVSHSRCLCRIIRQLLTHSLSGLLSRRTCRSARAE